MAMGIDQEIQRRMDAYRGNPQGLQQRYQMSQQLLDLLALQKLKAEKDAVARQMQSQMQQQPGTVAQQMEQEMVGRTKQEMAQQVGGVMQQQARQQQQNAARMAQAMARPQGGIAGLAPQSARMAGGGIVPPNFTDLIRDPETGKLIPKEAYDKKYPEPEKPFLDRLKDSAQEFAKWLNTNPLEERVWEARGNLSREEEEEILKRLAEKQDARMAGGGIVAFQRGGALSDEERRDRELFYARYLAGDPLLQRIEAVTRSRARSYTDPNRVGEGSFESAPSEIRNYLPLPAAAPEKAEPAGGMAGVDDREGPPDLAPGPDSGDRGRDMGGLGVLLPGETVESGAQPKRAQPRSVISNVRDIEAPTIPEQSSRTGEIESGIATLREQGDPMKQLRQLSTFTDQYMRRGDIRKAGEERARRLAELDRAQMDPEALRRERLMASLIGAAGKSTFGLTGAGAAAGAENARQQQRIAERQRLIDQMALERETEKTDIELAKEGLAAGKVGYEQAALNRRAAEDIAMRLGADETKRIVQNARAELDALVANQQIDIEAAKDVAAQALQTLKERGDDRRALEQELGDIQRKRADFYKEAMDLLGTSGMFSGDLTPEEKKAVEDEALVKANAWANAGGLLAAEQRLAARLAELGGSAGVDVDSLTQISQ